MMVSGHDSGGIPFGYLKTINSIIMKIIKFSLRPISHVCKVKLGYNITSLLESYGFYAVGVS